METKVSLCINNFLIILQVILQLIFSWGSSLTKAMMLICTPWLELTVYLCFTFLCAVISPSYCLLVRQKEKQIHEWSCESWIKLLQLYGRPTKFSEQQSWGLCFALHFPMTPLRKHLHHSIVPQKMSYSYIPWFLLSPSFFMLMRGSRFVLSFLSYIVLISTDVTEYLWQRLGALPSKSTCWYSFKTGLQCKW